MRRPLLLLAALTLAGCAPAHQQTQAPPPPPVADRTDTSRHMTMRLVSVAPEPDVTPDGLVAIERTATVRSEYMQTIRM